MSNWKTRTYTLHERLDVCLLSPAFPLTRSPCAVVNSPKQRGLYQYSLVQGYHFIFSRVGWKFAVHHRTTAIPCFFTVVRKNDIHTDVVLLYSVFLTTHSPTTLFRLRNCNETFFILELCDVAWYFMLTVYICCHLKRLASKNLKCRWAADCVH